MAISQPNPTNQHGATTTTTGTSSTPIKKRSKNKNSKNNNTGGTHHPNKHAPPASGGGGQDLPPFDFDARAGRSNISGNGAALPRLGVGTTTATKRKTEKGGSDRSGPLLPRGTGPHPAALEREVVTSAEVAGMGMGMGMTDPRAVRGVLGGRGDGDGKRKRTAWVD